MAEPERESAAVLDWCRNLTRILADGAVWGIPRSGIAFKIDKKKQCLVLTVGDTTDPDFIATHRVFQQIGWDVLSAEEYRSLPNDKPAGTDPENN